MPWKKHFFLSLSLVNSLDKFRSCTESLFKSITYGVSASTFDEFIIQTPTNPGRSSWTNGNFHVFLIPKSCEKWKIFVRDLNLLWENNLFFWWIGCNRQLGSVWQLWVVRGWTFYCMTKFFFVSLKFNFFLFSWCDIFFHSSLQCNEQQRKKTIPPNSKLRQMMNVAQNYVFAGKKLYQIFALSTFFVANSFMNYNWKSH